VTTTTAAVVEPVWGAVGMVSSLACAAGTVPVVIVVPTLVEEKGVVPAQMPVTKAAMATTIINDRWRVFVVGLRATAWHPVEDCCRLLRMRRPFISPPRRVPLIQDPAASSGTGVTLSVTTFYASSWR
jgi:hypothetical protein